MVQILTAFGEDDARAADGGVADFPQQHLSRHMEGAGSGEKQSARAQQAQGEVVEASIGLYAFLHVLARFDQRRRIEDDEIKALPLITQQTQAFQGIALLGANLSEAIGCHIALQERKGAGGGVDCQHLAGSCLGERQGECTTVAEQVEHPAPRSKALQQAAIGTVIVEPAGLLSGIRIDRETAAIFFDLDGSGYFAGQHFDPLGQSFHLARDASRLEQDALLRNFRLQCRDDLGKVAFHALTANLQHQKIPVAVDDQTGQTIAFAMHQTIVGRIEQTLPQTQGSGKAPAVEADVDGLAYIAGQQTGTEQGMRTEMGESQGMALTVFYLHYASWFQLRKGGLCGIDLVAVDPNVARTQAAIFVATEAEGRVAGHEGIPESLLSWRILQTPRCFVYWRQSIAQGVCLMRAEIRPIRWQDHQLLLLDQRRLPAEETYLELADYRAAGQAITDMVVRGAPAIGITAAYAMVLAMDSVAQQADWQMALAAAAEELRAARPTAVNLAWAIDRQLQLARAQSSAAAARTALLQAAHDLLAQDIADNQRMGRFGVEALPERGGILTHCNTGSLATGGYGTALGVIRAGFAAGRDWQIYADETRPWLQGARLTAWELQKEGIPFSLNVDAASGHLMATGRIQAVIVGADRIAANGDAANKIGTYSLAVLAHYHQIPFFVAAPLSTVDFAMPEGSQIVIEERAADEVRNCGGRQMSPAEVAVRNPAFDVTPAKLIAGIITERGVARAPYTQALAALRG